MKRTIKRIIILSIFILFIFLCKKTFATTISFNKGSVNVGEAVTITVSVPNVNTCSVYANVSGAGTSGTVKVVGMNMSGGKETFSNSITVTPTSTGTISVSITGDSNAVADGNYVNVGASNSITVNNAPTSSQAPAQNNSNNSNNNTSSSKTVKTIITSPVDFSGFRTNNKGPYRVTVENSVKQLKITVKYSDGTSNTITKNLTEGSNSFNIDGYNIIATRKVQEGEETVPNTIDKEDKKEDEEEQEEKILRLENIVLDDTLNVKLEPNFDPEIFEYKVILGNNYLDLDKLLISTMANIEGATVTIDGNEDFVDGENIITITVEAEGCETVWYRIKVIRGTIEQTKVYEPEKNDYNMTEVIRNKIIISASVFLIFLIGIIFVIKERYESKMKKEEKNSSAWDDEPLIKENKYRYDDNKEDNSYLEDIYIKNKQEDEKENLEDIYIKNKQEELTVDEKTDNFLNKLRSLNEQESEDINEESNIENKKKDEELERIKEEFFSADRIEFDEKVKRERKERRRGKGKHA